jgi:hypothetical protein
VTAHYSTANPRRLAKGSDGDERVVDHPLWIPRLPDRDGLRERAQLARELLVTLIQNDKERD